MSRGLQYLLGQVHQGHVGAATHVPNLPIGLRTDAGNLALPAQHRRLTQGARQVAANEPHAARG
jgi:hypothetical protein